MARITREEVEHVAILARLSLRDDEVERLSTELEAILDYAETLKEVDTTDVRPMSHVLPLATPLREDRAATPLDPRTAVSNAPESAGSAFVVPRVIDGEEEG